MEYRFDSMFTTESQALGEYMSEEDFDNVRHAGWQITFEMCGRGTCVESGMRLGARTGEWRRLHSWSVYETTWLDEL